VARGQRLDAGCLARKRPGTGLSPAWTDLVQGGRAARDLPADHILGWSDFCFEDPAKDPDRDAG
jgi:sialic acid synthase SpsE